MIELTNTAVQTVAAGQSVVYNATAVKGGCAERHRAGSAQVVLTKPGRYLVGFSGNIAIPTGGAAGEISLALTYKPCPKVLDWEQDAQMIITEVNNVAGRELRGEAFVHWWTFLSYFNAMRAENPLHMIMTIRSKKAKGQQLDKSERKYYSENREKVDFQTPETAKIAEEKAYLEKWL